MNVLIGLGAMALLVRVGQALYAMGLSRSKNAAGAGARSLVDLCTAVLAFWLFGAAILFQQHNEFLGIKPSMIAWWGLGSSASVVFFQTIAVVMATGALVGTLAERSRFLPACVGGVLVAGVLVPIAGKWAWSGWLASRGFLDVAGASAIHLSAGVCAAVGAKCVGARNGKYHRDGSASMIPGHSVPLATAGVMIMLAGWAPYVAGYAMMHHAPVELAAVNILIGGAGGCIGATLLSRVRYMKVDVTLVILGFLGGLVAMTGCAGLVSPPASVAIGLVAGLLVPTTSMIIDLIIRIDDPTGGISIHAIGGAWSSIAAGLFLPVSFAHRLKQTGVQLLGILAIAALALVLSSIVFCVLGKTVGLRARETDEFDGLDLAEHDIGAYPDFQQTMIKSYHLREA